MTRPTKRECRHERVARALPVYFEKLTRAIVDGLLFIGPGLRMVDVRRCVECNELLPLGPSDETDPRVSAEIEAARIIAINAADGAPWSDDAVANLLNAMHHIRDAGREWARRWVKGRDAARRSIAIGHDAEQAGEES